VRRFSLRNNSLIDRQESRTRFRAKYVTFYAQVDDLAAYLAKAESLGGKTMLPPMPVPGVGSIAMFTDPENHIIGLFKPA
jgi:predicted enzyme related to lactoylglutathione lyase